MFEKILSIKIWKIPRKTAVGEPIFSISANLQICPVEKKLFQGVFFSIFGGTGIYHSYNLFKIR